MVNPDVSNMDMADISIGEVNVFNDLFAIIFFLSRSRVPILPHRNPKKYGLCK